MTITVLLMWDYDTPAGFDVSRHSRDADPLSDYRATDRILALQAAHGVVSTFACVGLAAQAGPLPYHNPAQIRAIHDAGHEIASHSHRHELIPTLDRATLLATCRESKAALEACIGAPVDGFVPPWNRPFHHPRRLAVSTKDWRAGGGRWRQSVTTLAAVLAASGYRWLRVLYTPLGEGLRRRLQPARRKDVRPLQLTTTAGIATLRLSYCGYDRPLRDWLSHRRDADPTVLIYAHPHAIAYENSQHWRHLVDFMAWVTEHRSAWDIRFTTPRRWLGLDD